jgi:hypothetical protein
VGVGVAGGVTVLDTVPLAVWVEDTLCDDDPVFVGGGVRDADSVGVAVPLLECDTEPDRVGVCGGVMVGVFEPGVKLALGLVVAESVGVRVRGVTVDVCDAEDETDPVGEPLLVAVCVFGGVTVPDAVPVKVCVTVALCDVESVFVGGGVRDAVGVTVAVLLPEADGVPDRVSVRGGVIDGVCDVVADDDCVEVPLLVVVRVRGGVTVLDPVPLADRVALALSDADRVRLGGGVRDAESVGVAVPLLECDVEPDRVGVCGGVMVGVFEPGVTLALELAVAESVGVRVRRVAVGVCDAVIDVEPDAVTDVVGVGVFGGVTVPVAVPLGVCEVVPLGDMEPVLVGGGVRDAVADAVAVALTDCDADNEGVRVRGGVTVDV